MRRGTHLCSAAGEAVAGVTGCCDEGLVGSNGSFHRSRVYTVAGLHLTDAGRGMMVHSHGRPIYTHSVDMGATERDIEWTPPPQGEVCHASWSSQEGSHT